MFAASVTGKMVQDAAQQDTANAAASSGQLQCDKDEIIVTKIAGKSSLVKMILDHYASTLRDDDKCAEKELAGLGWTAHDAELATCRSPGPMYLLENDEGACLGTVQLQQDAIMSQLFVEAVKTQSMHKKVYCSCV